MKDDEQLTAEEKAASEAFERAFADPPPQLPARDETTGQFVATDKAKPAEEAKPKEPEKKPESKAKPAKEPAPAKPAAPAAFAVTEEQWNSVLKKLETAEKLSGSVGNLHTMVNQLRSATPQGVQIELPPELEAEYPELAAHLKRAKIKGTAVPAATDAKPSITDEEIKKLIGESVDAAHKDVDAKLRQARQRIEAEALDDLHPDWREIVGAGETHDPELPYRKWLSRQAAEYQKLINETDSAVVIGRSIDKFKAAAKAQPANGTRQPNPVTDRRRAAIQPKGDGGQPAPNPNAAEALMQQGFDS